MAQSCPNCKEWLPTVRDEFCPRCRANLSDRPANTAEVPDKMTVAGNSFEHAATALVLLLVMAGMGYGFVRALADKETVLAIVFVCVFVGCGVVLSNTIRNLIGWLRAR